MRVHIFEQFMGGHHTNYLAALLQRLAPLKRDGQIERLVVSITKRHHSSLPFRQQLACFEDAVVIDNSVPDVNPALALKDRMRVARNFRAATRKHAADITISTTADQETLVAGLLPGFHSSLVPPVGRTIGIIHAGYAGQANNLANRAKDIVYRLGLRYAPWTKIGIVNPLVYEWAVRHLPWRADRFVLIPDPVPRVESLSASNARDKLGLPLEGTYVGHVGTTDKRKAIPELLAAFKSVARPNERLLLAGRLSDDHRTLVESGYADMVASGAIILIDRYLDPVELDQALSALNVVAVPHYPRVELSANFLRAVAAGRPLLADRYGYTGAMIERFAIGHSCNVLDAAELADALRKSMDSAASYRVSESVRQLVAFHSLDNFAATVLASVLPVESARLGLVPLSWQWTAGIVHGC